MFFSDGRDCRPFSHLYPTAIEQTEPSESSSGGRLLAPQGSQLPRFTSAFDFFQSSTSYPKFLIFPNIRPEGTRRGPTVNLYNLSYQSTSINNKRPPNMSQPQVPKPKQPVDILQSMINAIVRASSHGIVTIANNPTADRNRQSSASK
jgi:hypothetical protein